MNNNENNNQKGILNHFIRLVQGFLLGAFSWIPFVNVKSLKDTMGIKDEDNNKLSIGKKYLNFFKTKWAYALGAILGAVFFFLIPVTYLTENFPTPLYSGLLALIVGFFFLDFAHLFANTGKKHNISALICFCASLIVSIVINFIDFSKITDLNTASAFPAVLFLMAIATFVVTFSGESIGSIFFLSSFYLNVFNVMTDVSRLKDIKTYAFFLASALVGALIGWCLSFLIRNTYSNLEKEKAGVNFGIVLPSLILLIVRHLKGATFNSFTDQTAQICILISTVLGCLAIGIALSLHEFGFLHEYEDDKFEAKVEEPIPPSLHDLLIEGLNTSTNPLALIKEEAPVNIAEAKTDSVNPTIKEPINKPTASTSSSGIDLTKLRALEKELKK